VRGFRPRFQPSALANIWSNFRDRHKASSRLLDLTSRQFRHQWQGEMAPEVAPCRGKTFTRNE
jgi:hypothetical protein